MPLVPPRLLTWLAGLDDPVAVCEVDGRLEPLLGRYSASAAETLAAALARGRALRDAVARSTPAIVDEAELARFGDPARIVFNVNSPEDLDRAEGCSPDRALQRPRDEVRRRRGSTLTRAL